MSELEEHFFKFLSVEISPFELLSGKLPFPTLVSFSEPSLDLASMSELLYYCFIAFVKVVWFCSYAKQSGIMLDPD